MIKKPIYRSQNLRINDLYNDETFKRKLGEAFYYNFLLLYIFSASGGGSPLYPEILQYYTICIIMLHPSDTKK